MAIKQAQTDLQQRIDTARKDLLDLSLRNSLLNCQVPKARGIEVVDESSREVFRLLVREKKSMAFVPDTTQDKAPRIGDGEDGSVLPPVWLETIPEDTTDARKYTDLKLQTHYSTTALQRRLLKTHNDARTSVEEQGVNILYLALGLLEWYEADSSQLPRRAPLLLLPVELTRSDIRTAFQLRYTEDELGENLSLSTKLQADFGVRLPTLPDADDLDVDAFFAEVAQTVKVQSRWRVVPQAIMLNFFSFNKFLLYKDLDAASWPPNQQPAEHPILRAVFGAGFPGVPTQLQAGETLDTHPVAVKVQTVLDADSSQALTLVDARSGQTMVIQGPPGTGKSQTITNLIADALGQGKTVLFVAEKMDALDVVKRRLDGVGLGRACLELHSHTVNKKTVLGELFKTLNTAQPTLATGEEDIVQLAETRARLNAYCTAVGSPIGASGETPQTIFGKMLTVTDAKPQSLPSIKNSAMENWSKGDYTRNLALVEEVGGLVDRLGSFAATPFYGSKRTRLLPSEREQTQNVCTAALTTVARLEEIARRLAEPLGLPQPADTDGIERLASLAQRVLMAPPLAGIAVASPDWLNRASDIYILLTTGAALTALYQQYSTVFRPEAWQQDVSALRQTLVQYNTKWYRGLAGGFKRAEAAMSGLCAGAMPEKIDDQIALLDVLLHAQQQNAVFGQLRGLGVALFGRTWQEYTSEWPTLRALAQWLYQLHADIQATQLPQGLMAFLARTPNLDLYRQTEHELSSARQAQQKSIEALIAQLELDETIHFGKAGRLAARTFADQRAIIEQWIAQLPALVDILLINDVARRCRTARIPEVYMCAESWKGSGAALVQGFQQSWLNALLERAYRERPALSLFSRETHERAIRAFQTLDRTSLRYTSAQLALLHWRAVTASQTNSALQPQMNVVRQEFTKKIRLMPIRKLIRNAGPLIQLLKPIFMMSPLSIAAYIPPGTLQFDIVIFDEASQVRPADAFGALLRGRQAIIVGDDQQLPPTSFFDKITQLDSESEAEDNDDLSTLRTGDYESVLGLFQAKTLPRMLRWHYRSRHESLIAVSNAEFYQNNLIVFPSPETDRADAGLRYHHLPQTVYDRSKSRTNPLEAQAVAKAVMQHARTQPEYTLGVATFSTAQRDATTAYLEMLRQQDPSCESFFAAHAEEPFFVKSLEHVQGDERDVIYISVGYGRDGEGKLKMNFGPLNAEGGQRRLNVLITRARLRCEVFTNITADDIHLSAENDQAGLRAFKIFLAYAKDRTLSVALPTGRGSDSPFEAAVYATLTRTGYHIEQQIGQAGYFIDMAVVDPQMPGRYILGIECDGATYHSALAARDRDRLRQQVLEGLGWRIHRIWSTDWFKNPAQEIERTIAAIEQARSIARVAQPAREELPENVVLFRPVAPSHPFIEQTSPQPSFASAATTPTPYQMAQIAYNIQLLYDETAFERAIGRNDYRRGRGRKPGAYQRCCAADRRCLQQTTRKACTKLYSVTCRRDYDPATGRFFVVADNDATTASDAQRAIGSCTQTRNGCT